MLIRALFEYWVQSSETSELANIVQSFIIVQVGQINDCKKARNTSYIMFRPKYNALLNIARIPNSSWYALSWTGPPIPSRLPQSQLAALDVFNAVVGLSDESTAT